MLSNPAAKDAEKDQDQPTESLKDTFILQQDSATFQGADAKSRMIEVALSCDGLATISEAEDNYLLRYSTFKAPEDLKTVPIEKRFCHQLGFGITYLSDTRFLLGLRDPGPQAVSPSGIKTDIINLADQNPLKEAKATAALAHPHANGPRLVNQNEIMIRERQNTFYSMDNLSVPCATFSPPVMKGGGRGKLCHLTGTTYVYWYENGYVTLHNRNDKELKQLGGSIDLSTKDKSQRYFFKQFGSYLVRINEYRENNEVALFKFDGAGFTQTCTVPRYDFVGAVWSGSDFARLIVRDPFLSKAAPEEFITRMLDPETGRITAKLDCPKEATSLSCTGEHLALLSYGKGVKVYRMESGITNVVREFLRSGLSLFKVPGPVSDICAAFVGMDVKSNRAVKK